MEGIVRSCVVGTSLSWPRATRRPLNVPAVLPRCCHGCNFDKWELRASYIQQTSNLKAVCRSGQLRWHHWQARVQNVSTVLHRSFILESDMRCEVSVPFIDSAIIIGNFKNQCLQLEKLLLLFKNTPTDTNHLLSIFGKYHNVTIQYYIHSRFLDEFFFQPPIRTSVKRRRPCSHDYLFSVTISSLRLEECH